MFTRRSILAFTLCLAMSAPAFAQPTDSRVEGLVRKLGSPSYLKREQARKELESIGTPALDSLRRTARSSDAETNRRIDDLIRVLEHRQLTEQILAPKELTLKLKDAGVQQAIAELANQSGYPLQFLGDATRFADKKVTLEGKLPFWEALDKLCEQAGLMERIEVGSGISHPVYNPNIRRLPGPAPVHAPAGPIVLVLRGNEKSLVSHAGSIKTEVRITRDTDAKVLDLLFVIRAEPRLLNYALVGRPVLDRAIDGQGGKLSVSFDVPKAPKEKLSERELERLQFEFEIGMPKLNRRVTQIRVKDELTAKQLKELAGKLALQVDLQNEVLARLDKVMDATGKSADGVNGGSLKVSSIKKLANGHIEAQISLENLGKNPFGDNVVFNGAGGVMIRGNVAINGGGGMVIGPGGVRINGNGNGNLKDLPDLLDAKGQKFKLISVSGDSFNLVNTSHSRTATVVYQPMPGQVEPSQLVLFGTRTYTISVPFRFENLPLPPSQ